MTNHREQNEFGDGVTINPEMAVAANDTIPDELPWWFDYAIYGALITLAVIVFTAIYLVLTWQ